DCVAPDPWTSMTVHPRTAAWPTPGGSSWMYTIAFARPLQARRKSAGAATARQAVTRHLRAGDAHPGPSLQEGGGYATETHHTDSQPAGHHAAGAALLPEPGQAESRLASCSPQELVGGRACFVAARLTHRSRPHPGSRGAPELVAAVQEGTLVLDARHFRWPHSPVGPLRRAGPGGRVTRASPRGRGEATSPPMRAA